MELQAKDIDQLILTTVADLRADLALPVLEAAGPETPLLGGGSDLDSMALVNLIADLEGRLQERYGADWILADERAFSRHRSPFRSVGDLRDFIIESVPK